MQAASPMTADETRVRALRELGVLDAPAEPELDDLVRVAAHVCGVPMSSLMLVDADREWCMAAFGLPRGANLPRTGSVCDHVIASQAPVVVPDTTRDPRFATHPLDRHRHPGARASRCFFERFFRGEAARDGESAGAGLGLSVTKVILDAHAATISLESEPGKGADIRIAFPRWAPPESTSQVTEPFGASVPVRLHRSGAPVRLADRAPPRPKFHLITGAARRRPPLSC